MTPFTLSPGPTGPVLQLTGECGVAHARELHAGLVAALADGAALRIDAAACTGLDLAALQILTASASATPVRTLVARSPAWADAWRRYGLPDPFCPTIGYPTETSHAQDSARSG